MTTPKWTAEIIAQWMPKMSDDELRALVRSALERLAHNMDRTAAERDVMFYMGELWGITERRATRLSTGHDRITLNAMTARVTPEIGGWP